MTYDRLRICIYRYRLYRPNVFDVVQNNGYHSFWTVELEAQNSKQLIITALFTNRGVDPRIFYNRPIVKMNALSHNDSGVNFTVYEKCCNRREGSFTYTDYNPNP